MRAGGRGGVLRAPLLVDLPKFLNRHPPTRPVDDRAWYRIVNRAAPSGDSDTDDVAEVWIYDEIGWMVQSGPFARDLAAITAGQIRVRMNTPGGSVFDGLAIYNALAVHPANITVHVDGLAASAGSFIAQAGDRVIMSRNAQMMIHDAAGLCMGNASDMAEMAALLDKVSDNLAEIYHDRAGGTVAEWRDRMRAETWYSAAEAVKAGLADAMAPAPKRRGQDDEPEPDPAPDEDDEDEGKSADALTREHDLTGRYRYAGRDQAPDPLPVPAEPEATPAALAAGGTVTSSVPVVVGDAGCTFTITPTATTAGTGVAPTLELRVSGGTALDDATRDALRNVIGPKNETDPDPASAEGGAPDPEPGSDDETEPDDDVGDADDRDEPTAWADAVAGITHANPWFALTAPLTKPAPTVNDLLTNLRHKEPLA